MHHHLAVMRLLDEVVQHLLGLLEVGDDAILHRLDRDDVAGRAPKHLFGFLAHGFYFTCHSIDGDDRRLVHDDALTVRKDERVRSPKIDRQIAGKEREDGAHITYARGTRLKIL